MYGSTPLILGGSTAMQCHRPAATTRLEHPSDRALSVGRALECDRKILMVWALTNQLAGQMAITAHVTVYHRRTLERVETKVAIPDRHESLCRRPAGGFCRDDRADPTTLQPYYGKHPTRLQGLTEIGLASAGEERNEQRTG